MNLKLRIAFGSLAVFALLVPALTSAESIVWSSSSLPGGGVPTLTNNDWLEARNAVATVQYLAGVSLVNDGGATTPLSCGASVPRGSRVAFTFTPHVGQHISWFAAGEAWDSPYGLWIRNATQTYPRPCDEQQYYFLTTPRGHDTYLRLVVNPPTKSVAGLSGASCTPSGTSGDMICTVSDNLNASFVFGSTYGHFYYDEDYKGCSVDGALRADYDDDREDEDEGNEGDEGEEEQDEDDAYTLPVSQQVISCPITVTDTPGTPPITPTLSSGAACTVGTPHTITMSATDPDNDNIRYGIDWNADGSIDEYVPPSGYIPSGTTENAARTYSTNGPKTVQVLAQDEGGLTSSWATTTFSCVNPPEPPTSCPTGYELRNNICVFLACPQGFELRGGVCVATIAQQCGGFVCRGNDLYERSPQCVESFYQSCMLGCAASACILPPLGTGEIRAQPSLIKSGETTKISWVSNGMTACLVTENIPDISDSSNELSGSFTSSPIHQQTTYTLTCTKELGAAFVSSAVVNIIPIFKEN